MAKGIIEQGQLLVTVVFAATVGMMGVDFLLSGQRLVGGGFLALAILMVLIEEYVTKPTDLATETVTKAVGTVLTDPDESDTESSDTRE